MLENKLNITNHSDLAKAEEKISKQKAKQLFDSKDIDKVEVGSFAGLAFIHNYLFEDIYRFAGQIRTVNIAKGNFRFAPVMYLKQSLEYINRMPQNNFEIKYLLRNALNDKINDRTLFMKGIDIGYYYEGYNEFKTEEL